MINVTTTDTVPQSPDPRETSPAKRLAEALNRIEDLPKPVEIRGHRATVIIDASGDLGRAMPWVYALQLTPDGQIRRQVKGDHPAAYSCFTGAVGAVDVELYVCEPADRVGAALVTAARVLDALPGASDYFREDVETGAPIPDGVEGHHLGSRSVCLAEGGE